MVDGHIKHFATAYTKLIQEFACLTFLKQVKDSSYQHISCLFLKMIQGEVADYDLHKKKSH